MYEIKNFNFSEVADADVESMLLMKITSTGVAVAGDTDVVIGATTNSAKAGHAVPLAQGIVRVVAGGAIARGDKVMATAGKALKATSGKAIAGIALTAAAGDKEVISVLLPVGIATLA